MIDFEKYKLILDEGLMLDHYFLLLNLRDKKTLVPTKRIQGFINLMCKKGYINGDGELTLKASKLIEGEGNPIPEVTNSTKGLMEVLGQKQKFDYATWIINLHRACEERLLKATGKRQARPKLDGTTYSFLPNSTDLGRVILRAINTYKLRDYDRIEKTILRYVDSCCKAGKWFPLLSYYIMKGGVTTASYSSSMVTDMSNDDDTETSGDNPSIHIV